MRHCTTLALLLSLSACERATAPIVSSPAAVEDIPLEPGPTAAADTAPPPPPAVVATPAPLSIDQPPPPPIIRRQSRAYRPWRNEAQRERVQVRRTP